MFERIQDPAHAPSTKDQVRSVLKAGALTKSEIAKAVGASETTVSRV